MICLGSFKFVSLKEWKLGSFGPWLRSFLLAQFYRRDSFLVKQIGSSRLSYFDLGSFSDVGAGILSFQNLIHLLLLNPQHLFKVIVDLLRTLSPAPPSALVFGWCRPESCDFNFSHREFFERRNQWSFSLWTFIVSSWDQSHVLWNQCWGRRALMRSWSI